MSSEKHKSEFSLNSMNTNILLTTERLILRQLSQADAENIYEVKSELANPERSPSFSYIYNHWLPNILAYYQEGYGFGYWAAVERATSTFIGWFYFRSAPDESTATAIGYFLRPFAWGKGYATEGAQALIHKGFTKLNIEIVIATALASNAASIRVMEKVGLRFEKWLDADDSQTKAVQYFLRKDMFDALSS